MLYPKSPNRLPQTCGDHYTMKESWSPNSIKENDVKGKSAKNCLARYARLIWYITSNQKIWNRTAGWGPKSLDKRLRQRRSTNAKKIAVSPSLSQIIAPLVVQPR